MVTEHKSVGLVSCVATVVALLTLALAWSWTPMAAWLDAATLSNWIGALKGSSTTPFVLMAAYGVGSLILFPITLLILATAFAYGPAMGFIYSLLGCMLGAILTYVFGYSLGYDVIRRVAGKQVARVNEAAASHGLVAMLMTHLIPVAPFTIVNMIAGASGIRFRDFLLGTTLGMTPGIALITFFEHQVESALREPGIGGLIVLLTLAAIGVAAMAIIRRRLTLFPSTFPPISAEADGSETRRTEGQDAVQKRAPSPSEVSAGNVFSKGPKGVAEHRAPGPVS